MTIIIATITFLALHFLIVGKGFTQLIRGALGLKKPHKQLKSELKKVMFTADQKPIVICGNKAKFKMVMDALSNYEKEASF